MKTSLVTLLGALALCHTAALALAPATAPAPSAYLAGKSSAKSTPLTLAEAGTALLPITIHASASVQTKAVAQELATYLERISGAKFVVTTGDGSSGIVLGNVQQFPHPDLQKSLVVRKTYDGVEAYVIRSEPKRLLLLGNSDSGVSHAVFRLLETLGHRRYFPAPEWEVVPTHQTLRVNLDEAGRPAILSRRIWYGYGVFTESGKPYAQMRPVQDYNAWMRQNRMDQSVKLSLGHAWGNIITQYKAEFEKHPEYLAMVKGRRQTLDMRLDHLKICPGQPGVQQLVANYTRQQLLKFPDRQSVSLDPSDGGGHCECDKCLALGSISNRVFTLANVAAAAIQKDFPGKMVALYAYSEHSVPPTFKLEPNVYVELTAGFNTGDFTFPELVELWSKMGIQMGYYMYFSVWSATHDVLAGDVGSDVNKLQEWIGKFADRGAVSLTAESGNNWGPNGRGYYIANRLMWDPKAPMEELLTDFYQGAFGAGALPMRRFYERLDPGNNPIRGKHLLAMAFRDVQDASNLAKGDAAVQARLTQLKAYLHYAHLSWMYDRVDKREKEPRRQATIDIFTWAYRNRFSYMNHWMAMQQGWGREASIEFAEPAWHAANRDKKPWQDETPVLPEEIEQRFQEGLAYFQPQPVTEKQFSKDLVSVTFPGTGPAFSTPAATTAKYQGGPTYYLYSRTGEDLKLDITPGLLPIFRNKAPAKYVVTDADGKVVQEGRMALDNTKNSLAIKVPKAGLYTLDFTDSLAGWHLEVASDVPASMRLEPTRRMAHLGQMQPMYFYVPKGSATVDFFNKGYKFKVKLPGGKDALDVPTTLGEYFSIPVQAGQDGKVWSVQGLALSHFGFFNVPNLLAASPAALLIPREVAQADGLMVK